jgi:TonB family protein
MSAVKNRTTIALGGNPKALSNGFPRECRRTLSSQFDPRFSAIFGVLVVVSFCVVWVLSHRKIDETVSVRGIEKIQERYAQLVLNQPKPKIVEPLVEEKVEARPPELTGAQAPAEKAVPVDRDKETFVERVQRRQASRMQREAAREHVTQQVRSSGIFAAITASGSGGGGGGSSSSIADFLGATSQIPVDLAGINITKGTFATVHSAPGSGGKAGGDLELASRRVVAAGGADIALRTIEKVEDARLASAGEVTITTQSPQITGEIATTGERSMEAINRAVNRYKSRLVRVYETWLKKDPALSGKIVIKFTIMSDGSVVNGAVVESTTGNGEFDQNILRYIARWTFPAAPEAGPIEVVYPFIFEGMP